MKTQKQVIVPPETDMIYCPYCEFRCTVKSTGRLYILDRACDHADMVVDAGRMEIAVHFVG